MVTTSRSVKNREQKQNANVPVDKDADETPEGYVDPSSLGDISQKNAVDDGLSDLERVRRGIEQRDEESDEDEADKKPAKKSSKK